MSQCVGKVCTITSIICLEHFFQFIYCSSHNEGVFNELASEGICIKFKGCSTAVLSNKITTSHMWLF